MSEKILIIDDEQDIADLLEVYLKNENYVVHKFYCATDAMSCIESGDIDLAFYLLLDTHAVNQESNTHIFAVRLCFLLKISE